VTPSSARPLSSRGFTLLEVLVAVAILGLGLTMILSSQVGLFSGASRGQHFTLATNLARCKMSEVQVELLKKGYPLTDQHDEGSCCGEDGEPGYTCEWKIERVELPEASEMSPDAGTGSATAEPNASPFDALGKLSSLGNPALAGSAGPPSLESLSASAGQAMAGGGLATMAMGMVYPMLKPMLEASIRKITLKVKWKEGVKERDLAVTQYVTDPQQGSLVDPLTGLPVDGGLMGGAIPGMPGTPGSPQSGTNPFGATGLGGLVPGLGGR
jgi:general secretion pathway protein I